MFAVTIGTSAIGNAANSRLAGGGGVDGAIHRAGGPQIMAELKAKYPQGCPTGQVVIPGGGRLKLRYILHVVHRIRTVTFLSISTGVYRYSVEEAAPIALRTVATIRGTFQRKENP